MWENLDLVRCSIYPDQARAAAERLAEERA